MTLDDLGRVLAELSNCSVRAFSTRNFGRQQYLDARSVVVPQERSRLVLSDVRSALDVKQIAFIGTTRWLGDEKHPNAAEIVIAIGDSQMDILRVAQSDAVNHDKDTDDLIAKLSEFDRRYNIDVFHAETDTIEFQFKELPGDLSAFSKELYAFCPDIVDQGVGSIEALERDIKEKKEVLLWWD